MPGDGTVHSGAALILFNAGALERVVKVDVASLYPSLMRAFRIGPQRDHLQALLFLVDRLVEQRLAAGGAVGGTPPPPIQVRGSGAPREAIERGPGWSPS
jgi:hypothetical protein